MKQQLGMIVALVAMGFSGWLASTTKHAHAAETQVSQSDEFPDWLKNSGTVLGLATGPGIAIWYLWYDVSRIKPKWHRDVREQIDSVIDRYIVQHQEMEKRHADHWTLSNNQFQQNLHELTKGFREDLLGLRTAIERLADATAKNGCQFEPPRNTG